MNKKHVLGLVVCLGLVWGCAHTAPTQFYTLESDRDKALAPAAFQLESLCILPVVLPSYLNTSSLVVRRGDTGLIVSRFQKWAEPLQDGFSRALRDSLSAALPKTKLFVLGNERPEKPVDKLRVVVHTFLPAEDGSVRLRGVWEVSTGGIRQAFDFSLPSGGRKPEAMVRTMGRAVDVLAADILANAAAKD